MLFISLEVPQKASLELTSLGKGESTARKEKVKELDCERIEPAVNCCYELRNGALEALVEQE